MQRTTLQHAARLLVVSLSSLNLQAQGLKPATRATPPGTRQEIEINNPYTQAMATMAGLDASQPQLSSDGIRGQDNPPLASSECLLFQTLVAKQDKVQTNVVESFCAAALSADNAAKMEAAKSALEEHNAGQRIDDAIIHLVVWKDGQADGTWYQYSRHAGKWKGKLLSLHSGDAVTELNYLLGHGNIAFLALHLGIDDSCKISYGIEAKHTRPINQQDVADLFQLVKDYYAKGKSGVNNNADNTKRDESFDIGIWGGATLLKLPTLPASIVLTPKTDNAPVTKTKAHDNWKVNSGCKPAKNNGNAAVITSIDNEDSPMAIATKIASHPSRARMTPAALSVTQSGSGQAGQDSNKDPLSGMKVTVQDEGLHWWDVSVALPVTSYNKLKFDSQNNFITVKNTNDIKPYGLVDFYFGGADLQAKDSISTLKLSAGIPMASRPLQAPFFGGGFTVAIKSFRFSPLAGLRVQKEQRTTTLTAGAPANAAQLTNDLHSEWHAKLQVMIGFSIADARKALGLK